MTKGEISKNQRFAEVIDELKKRGEIYNQTDLSNKLHKSKAYISQCLSGKRSITDRFINDLVSVFNLVNKDYITKGDGSPTITPSITATNFANQFANQYKVGDNANITLGGASCAENCTSVEQCIELLRTAQNTIDLLIKQRDSAQNIVLRTQDQLTKTQEQVDKLLSLLSNK